MSSYATGMWISGCSRQAPTSAKTPVPRLLRDFDNMNISNTRSHSQLYLHPAPLQQNNIGNCISSTMVLNFLCFSDSPSIMSHYENIKKRRKELNTLLKDSKISLQNAVQDILKNDNILCALISIAALLQNGKENLNSKRKSLTLVIPKLVNRPKNISINGSSGVKVRERIASLVVRHHGGLAFELAGKPCLQRARRSASCNILARKHLTVDRSYWSFLIRWHSTFHWHSDCAQVWSSYCAWSE